MLIAVGRLRSGTLLSLLPAELDSLKKTKGTTQKPSVSLYWLREYSLVLPPACSVPSLAGSALQLSSLNYSPREPEAAVVTGTESCSAFISC